MSNYETFVVPLLMGGGLSERKFSLSCLIDTLKSEYIFSLH